MMYEELVKRLRICPDYNEGCLNCPHEHDLGCRSSTMREAADAIESLIQENSFLKLMQQQLTKDIPENELGKKVYSTLKMCGF